MWRHRRADSHHRVDVNPAWESADFAEAFLAPPDCPVAAGSSASEDRLACLRQALLEFRASHSAATVSAHHMINPLIDLWSVATAVDQTAGAPIEALLTALIHRSIMTARELSAALDQVEMALAPLLFATAPGARG